MGICYNNVRAFQVNCPNLDIQIFVEKSKEAVQFGLENYTIIIVKIVTLPILVLNDANFG